MFLLGLLPSPILNDITEEKRELIHRIVLLADEYHQDPILALSVIHCESRFKPHPEEHVNRDGSRDFSYWQINSINQMDFKDRGFDITDPSQNLEAGMLMLKERGTQPWSASEKCWRGLSKP